MALVHTVAPDHRQDFGQAELLGELKKRQGLVAEPPTCVCVEDVHEPGVEKVEKNRIKS